MREELIGLFDTAKVEIETLEKWYNGRRKIGRAASFVLRGLAAAGFFFGTLLPLAVTWVKPENEVGLLSGGYLLLTTAAALIVIDQFLLGSASWSRSAKAYLELKFLREVLAFEKKRFELTVGANDTIAPLDNFTKVIEVIEQIRKKYHDLVTLETQSWSTDITASINNFSQSLQGIRSSAKEEVRAAAALQAGGMGGAVEVCVTGAKDQGITSMIVVINNLPITIPAPYTGPFVFIEVPSGLHKARLSWIAKDTTFVEEQVAIVEANKKTAVAFNVAPA